MRSFVLRPVLLFLTLVLVAGAIAFIELRLDAGSPVPANAGQRPDPPAAKERGKSERSSPPSSTRNDEQDLSERKRDPAALDAKRISNKEDEYPRAEEIVAPSGFVNTDGFSVREAAGKKVVLLEFWTYTCFNCQNVQPHLNAWHDEFSGDGLQIVGVHTPEFGFEKEYANVEAAVREASIEYPVVLDNSYATWDAYDNRFWPAIYLIDSDGFVRYRHFGEGAYGETQDKIEELLAEKNRISR